MTIDELITKLKGLKKKMGGATEVFALVCGESECRPIGYVEGHILPEEDEANHVEIAVLG